MSDEVYCQKSALRQMKMNKYDFFKLMIHDKLFFENLIATSFQFLMLFSYFLFWILFRITFTWLVIITLMSIPTDSTCEKRTFCYINLIF